MICATTVLLTFFGSTATTSVAGITFMLSCGSVESSPFTPTNSAAALKNR